MCHGGWKDLHQWPQHGWRTCLVVSGQQHLYSSIGSNIVGGDMQQRLYSLIAL